MVTTTSRSATLADFPELALEGDRAAVQVGHRSAGLRAQLRRAASAGFPLGVASGSESLNGAARSVLFKLCDGLEHGTLTVRDRRGIRCFQGSGDRDLSVTLTVLDDAFYGATLLRGSLGVGESFVLEHVEVDDPVALVRLFVRNERAMDRLDFGPARLSQPLYRLYHLLRRNTRSGARENIGAHYDLGNDFYELFLDETLTYSAGIFERADTPLEEASVAKIDRLCRKLGLGPEDHLLEIGTGWGALAIHAARVYGCRVTTTTLSQEQAARARVRVASAGLTDRITVLTRDYRELTGRYSKLVSVEMVEAVGHHYLDTFFRRCCELLTDDGVMALQSITIRDQRYRAARDGVDFIKRYVFPGSCIPSVSVLADSVARNTDFRITHLEDLTAHYALTLEAWRSRFLSRRSAARALGYSERFLRLWDFYLAYCEAGFRERFIGDVQLTLQRPRSRSTPALPPLPVATTAIDDAVRAEQGGR